MPTLDTPPPNTFLSFFLGAILLCQYIWDIVLDELRSFFSASNKRSPSRTGSDELKRAFQTFDRNGDGRITKKELNESLENMGIFIPDKELSQMIGGDGWVDVDEFNALYQDIIDERGGGEEAIREAFDVFDQNGDGFISADELNSVLASLGLNQGRATEDCMKMITRVDDDGDGMVSFTEFKQMMRGRAFGALGN